VARATGKRTVAEGIETEAVGKMLRTFDVDYGQGFLWHKPEPLATLPPAAARAPRDTPGAFVVAG
jgi:EAL domain-containing protein (putative c-di-GMP-specific phosphodiesterase class I)